MRVFSDMTTSSREVLPARSPMPLTVTATWVAPAMTPAMALALARLGGEDPSLRVSVDEETAQTTIAGMGEPDG